VTFSLLLPQELFDAANATNSSGIQGGNRRLQASQQYSPLVALVRNALFVALVGVAPNEVLVVVRRASLTVDVAVLDGSLPALTVLAATSSAVFLVTLSASLGANVTFGSAPRVVVGGLSALGFVPPSTPAPPHAGNDHSTISVGLILGIVFGVLATLVLLSIAIFVLLRKHRSASSRTAPDPVAKRANIAAPSEQLSMDSEQLYADSAGINDPALPPGIDGPALLPGWVEHTAEDGTPYYHNDSSNESSWEPPVHWPGLAQLSSLEQGGDAADGAHSALVFGVWRDTLAAAAAMEEAESTAPDKMAVYGTEPFASPESGLQPSSPGIFAPAHRAAQTVALVHGWTKHLTVDGTPYFHNEDTGASSWEPPVAAKATPSAEPASPLASRVAAPSTPLAAPAYALAAPASPLHRAASHPRDAPILPPSPLDRAASHPRDAPILPQTKSQRDAALLRSLEISGLASR